MHREKFLYQSPPPLALPNNGTLLLLQTQSAFPQMWHFVPLPMAHCSLDSLGCLHIANPSPLPGTESQHPAPAQASQAVVFRGSGTDGLRRFLSALSSSVQLLHFSLWLWCLSILVDLLVRWIPFLSHSILSGVLLHLNSFLFLFLFVLLFYPVMWRFSWPFLQV